MFWRKADQGNHSGAHRVRLVFRAKNRRAIIRRRDKLRARTTARVLFAIFVFATVVAIPANAITQRDVFIKFGSDQYNLGNDGNCAGGIIGDNKDYAGNQVLSDAQMQTLQANQPFYESSAQQVGIPWQMIAAIHFREHGLARGNPTSNYDGPYQIVSKEYHFADDSNPTDAEFQSATNDAAQFIKDKAGGRDLSNSDNVKYTFFAYNGIASVYKQQALDLGFTQDQADNGEGSPYVMNRADKQRDPNTNPTGWGQIKRDYGSIEYPANNDYGAYVVYAALGGSQDSDTGSATCNSGSGSGSIVETAKALAWPTKAPDNNSKPPTDAYRDALAKFSDKWGCKSYTKGEVCALFVSIVMWDSGVDPDFGGSNPCSVSSNSGYMANHPEKYQRLSYTSTADLQPGDILENGDHIVIYIGDGQRADASLGERTASISEMYNSDWTVWRFIGGNAQ